MARLARLYVPDQPQNVVLRGLSQQNAFVDHEDCSLFVECLQESFSEHRVKLHAWSLLPDAALLLATPSHTNSLPLAIQAIGRRYVAVFNRRHARKGTLWEGRYRATVIEAEKYLLLATRVIETAAVRSGLAAPTEDYRWSSFRHHIGLAHDAKITDHPVMWALGNTPIERQMAYRDICNGPLDDDAVRSLNTATSSAWLLGSPEYCDWAATKANRRVVALPRGRRPNTSLISQATHVGSALTQVPVPSAHFPFPQPLSA